MMEEIVALLNHIKASTTMCGVFLLFILILMLRYLLSSLLDESQKRKEIERKENEKSLKEEIVKDITNYYDNTKEK